MKFELGKYEEAHTLIEKAQKEFPKRLDKTIFWEACIYSIQGNQENAIAVLKEGIQKGVWWNPLALTRDPDLNNLQNNKEFQVIVNECKDIFDSYKGMSSPKLFTYGNDKSNSGLFSLHWRGSNVKDFAPYWFDNNLLNDYLFGFPQSSQVFGYNAYCWDKQDIAVEEIITSYRDFKEKFNTKQDIIAGASQGGKLAIELSLNGNILGTKGFIAVIPAIQDLASLEGLLVRSENKIKGCIITGDKDFFYTKTVELAKLLGENDFQCKLMVKEGLGHFFPSDFTDLLKEAVDFIHS
ncbi:TPR end-of-group domain-containing protein [Bacillus sp. FJAT-27225]|uniref:TPR end-of-group domain-containing protein n=1 Tax=Bacillus sp. FJAT-27225 TaxID=1743144 RepID=UPI003F8BD6F7